MKNKEDRSPTETKQETAKTLEPVNKASHELMMRHMEQENIIRLGNISYYLSQLITYLKIM